MRTAYLDCASGISGDMMLGALVDVGVGLDTLNRVIDSLGLDNCRLAADEVRRGGFRATQVHVHAPSDQSARHLPEILQIIVRSGLNAQVKQQAVRIFNRLAEVEARAHGIAIEKVHFHELGAVDTIIDVVCTLTGFDLLGVDRVVASSIPTGTGRVKIAHGTVSVPAPATAELLRGVPLAESSVEAELTTPTGAVLVTSLAEKFGPMPAMTIESLGYGAGGRELAEQPNVLRLFVGQGSESTLTAETTVDADVVCLLETNLDDISGETIGYCIERLQQAGVLDVWTTAIQMKKNRPGVILSALCRPEKMVKIETILFREASTLGIRHRTVQRHVLRRRAYEVTTEWGTIQGKIRWLPSGGIEFSPEHEACRLAAKQHDVPIYKIREEAQKSFDASDIQ